MEQMGINIKGKITESFIEAPLSGVKLLLINKKTNETKQFYTNINGEYLFKGDEDTKYVLVLKLSEDSKKDKIFEFTTTAHKDRSYIKDYKIELNVDDYNSLKSNQISKLYTSNFIGKVID
jgi:hypothetical protein